MGCDLTRKHDWKLSARGFSPGTPPALAAKRMHQIVRMIFAAKAGRVPGGAARLAYKPIAVFGFKML